MFIEHEHIINKSYLCEYFIDLNDFDTKRKAFNGLYFYRIIMMYMFWSMTRWNITTFNIIFPRRCSANLTNWRSKFIFFNCFINIDYLNCQNLGLENCDGNSSFEWMKNFKQFSRTWVNVGCTLFYAVLYGSSVGSVCLLTMFYKRFNYTWHVLYFDQ